MLNKDQAEAAAKALTQAGNDQREAETSARHKYWAMARDRRVIVGAVFVILVAAFSAARHLR